MKKEYGVRMTLPVGNCMSMPHLLGDDFVAERWFNSENERSTFLKMYQEEYIYFRRGDKAIYNYELIS